MHTGDKWKINSRGAGQLGFNVTSFLTLKHMNGDIAVIGSEGKITSESPDLHLSDQTIKSDLKGTQEGEYKLERKTGMVTEGKTNSEIEGTLQAMGREIPVTIKYAVKINGKRIK